MKKANSTTKLDKASGFSRNLLNGLKMEKCSCARQDTEVKSLKHKPSCEL